MAKYLYTFLAGLLLLLLIAIPEIKAQGQSICKTVIRDGLCKDAQDKAVCNATCLGSLKANHFQCTDHKACMCYWKCPLPHSIHKKPAPLGSVPHPTQRIKPHSKGGIDSPPTSRDAQQSPGDGGKPSSRPTITTTIP
uniref:major pollen allergen Art v 1-like n=1 Tax=Erigeron canadensis TaxID=72917 RepID=UPI001CB8CE4C|nr:major pollen allergen Art v 1-like [Erigeron canadensis]